MLQSYFTAAAENCSCHAEVRSFPRSACKGVSIIRSMVPINLIMYDPKTPEGLETLAKRVSDVHASAVTQQINALNCPISQKLALLDAVIETVKARSMEKT